MASLRGGVVYFREKVASYAIKFGVVGLIGMVIDVSLFNLLRLGFFGTGHFLQDPIGAKILSVSVAIVFNWLGSRYWTFRSHRRKNFVAELAEYVTVSVGGMLIGLGCLWASHYALGFDNIVADNISSNVVGLGLGTLFRFTLYRFWVYGHHRNDGIHAASKLEEAETALFEEPETMAPGNDGGRVPPTTAPRGASSQDAGRASGERSARGAGKNGSRENRKVA